MSELVDCIDGLLAEDIIKSIAKTANGTPFYLQTTGGAAWSPASIAGLAYWFDASDISTLSLTAGDVDQWDDKSGNGRHVTPASNAPSWAANRITFDLANSENLRSGAFVIAQPYTVVVVWKKTVARDIASYMVGSLNAVAGGMIGTGTSGAGNFVANAGAALSWGNNDITTDHLHIVIFNGASSKYYLDDAASIDGNAGANATDGIEIGGYNNWIWIDAELMEVIGYSGAMSDEDRLLLKTYLQTKWGL